MYSLVFKQRFNTVGRKQQKTISSTNIVMEYLSILGLATPLAEALEEVVILHLDSREKRETHANCRVFNEKSRDESERFQNKKINK